MDKLLLRFEQFAKNMIPPDIAREEEKGNPSHFHGVYTSGWCKAEPDIIADSIYIDVI